MRRINMFLVFGILVTFILHGVAGALGLYGASQDAMKRLAWVCLFLIACHVLVTGILTFQTFRAIRRSGAGYFKNNRVFWLRRLSGLLILIPLVMHLTIFHSSNVGAYRLKEFTRGRMISQIFLVVTIGLHILTNIKPAFLSFGVKSHREYGQDFLLILLVILLFLMGAFVVYYLRWTAI